MAWQWRNSHMRIHLSDCALLPLGVVCSWVSGASLSVTACGLDVVYRNRLYQWMIRSLLKRADYVVCISEATADEVRKRGVQSHRIHCIPCGVSAPSFCKEGTREPLRLVTVGRLIQRKGIAWFIEHVFPRVLQQYPNIHYDIFGDGKERKHIQQRIRALHLEHAIALHANASDAVCRASVASASVFVAPNISIVGDIEGFGIVCIEASAMGTPVLAARIDGLKQAVIEGVTGRFFQPENVDDCVHVLSEMLATPFDAQDVHQHTMAQFSWSRLIPLYTHVFDA